jgi:hypothetical protein
MAYGVWRLNPTCTHCMASWLPLVDESLEYVPMHLQSQRRDMTDLLISLGHGDMRETLVDKSLTDQSTSHYGLETTSYHFRPSVSRTFLLIPTSSSEPIDKDRIEGIGETHETLRSKCASGGLKSIRSMYSAYSSGSFMQYIHTM